MWINRIDLTNFRSYTSESIELAKGINLIVGQNNSGKSTLLKSVAWLQVGSPVSAQDIRKLKQSGSVRLILEDSRKYFSQVTDFATDITLTLSNQSIATSGTGVSLRSINLDSIHPNYDDNAFSPTHTCRIPNQEPRNYIYPYLSKRKVTHFDEGINLQATNLVSGNFVYLAAKVDRLCDSTIPEHNEFIEACKDIIGFQLSAVASPNGKKAAQTIDAHHRIYLEEMGEGVANLLGLIVDLCVAKDKLFVIEEPENDIHPKALKKLLELIERKSKNY
jgi:AAA15 family ATPase/GTPase